MARELPQQPTDNALGKILNTYVRELRRIGNISGADGIIVKQNPGGIVIGGGGSGKVNHKFAKLKTDLSYNTAVKAVPYKVTLSGTNNTTIAWAADTAATELDVYPSPFWNSTNSKLVATTIVEVEYIAEYGVYIVINAQCDGV